MKQTVLFTVFVLLRPAVAFEDVRTGWDIIRLELAKLFISRNVDVAATLTALRRLQFMRAFVTEWIATSFFYKGGHRYQWRGHFSYETAKRLLKTGMGDEGGAGKKANLSGAIARLTSEDAQWVSDNIDFVNTLIIGALMEYGLVSFQGQGEDGFTLDLSYPGAASTPAWSQRPMPFTHIDKDGNVDLSPELRSHVAFSTFFHLGKDAIKDLKPAPERINVSLAVEAVMAVFNGIARVATDEVADPVDRLYDMMRWAWHSQLVGHKVSDTYADGFNSIVNFWASPPPASTEEPTLLQIDHAKPYVAKALAALRSHPFLVEQTIAEYRNKFMRIRQSTHEVDVPGAVYIGRNVPLPSFKPIMLGTQSTDLGLGEHYLVVDRSAESPYELAVDPAMTLEALTEVLSAMSGAPSVLSTVHGFELEVLVMCLAGKISFIKDEPQARMVMRYGPEADEVLRNPGESTADYIARVEGMKLMPSENRQHTLIYHFPVDTRHLLTLHKPLLMFNDGGDIVSTRHGEAVLMLCSDDCFGTAQYELAKGVDSALTPKSRFTIVASETWSPPAASIVARQTMTLETLVTQVSAAKSTPGNTVTELVRKDVSVNVALNIAYEIRTTLSDVSAWAPVDVLASMEERSRLAFFLYRLLYADKPLEMTIADLSDGTGATADLYYAYAEPTTGRIVRDRLAQPLKVAQIRRPSTAVAEVLNSTRVVFEARMASEVDRVSASPLVQAIETSALQVAAVSRSELSTIEAANAAAKMRAAIARTLLRCALTFNGRRSVTNTGTGASNNVITISEEPMWRPATTFVSLELTDMVYSNPKVLVNAGRPLMRRKTS